MKTLKVTKDLWISNFIRMDSSCQIIKNNWNKKGVFKLYDKYRYGKMGWKQNNSPQLMIQKKSIKNVDYLLGKLVPFLGEQNLIENEKNYKRKVYVSKGKNKFRYELKYRVFHNIISQI
jgi:hypothetical protein